MKLRRMKLPYIIAEIGLNHGGSKELALEMVLQAAKAGADAVKFQAVKADALVHPNSPTYFRQNGDAAQTQHEFFKRSDALGPDDYRELARHCQEIGIDFGCTAFTPKDVAWIDPLVKWHKIASADITNIPLLEAVGRTGKHVYLSTGAATLQELSAAIYTICAAAKPPTPFPTVTPLHCVLSYPTPLADANLGVICTLDGAGGGYSDHTLFNLDVLTTAWLLGASVIEKHFTLDKTLPGNDHYHSMDPTDLRALVAKLKELQVMIGDGKKRVLPCEEAAREHARRGLYAARDIPLGKVLEPADIAILRPSARLGPERYSELIGRAAQSAHLAGEPL